MLLFLLIPLLTQALLIHESNCVGDFCENNLKLYIGRANLRSRSDKESDKYFTVITHSQPGMPMSSLYMNVYTIGPRKIKVYDLTKVLIGNNFEIRIDLTEEDIKNPSKCSYVDTNDMHINYECIFCIEYTSQIQSDPIRIYIHSMIVKIPVHPKYDYYVEDSQIYEERCGCKLIRTLDYKVKLYKGASCTDKIATGATLIRGEDICIGVFSNDDTTKCYYFVFATLETTYISDSLEPTTTNMLGTSTIKRSLDRTNIKGQLYAIIPMHHIGRLEIKMVIALTETLDSESDIEEDLWPKGTLTDFSESLEVICNPLLSDCCEFNTDGDCIRCTNGDDFIRGDKKGCSPGCEDGFYKSEGHPNTCEPCDDGCAQCSVSEPKKYYMQRQSIP